MTIERKYIDLKDLTVTDEGPGHISGYRAVFSEIDEGGDLIVPGFFKDSIDEYLEAGFTAHSHDWDFDKAVGYPVSAKEDDHGFFVDSEFHSTPDAQSVRTKAVERKKAGKRVGFSFGYSVSDKSYIEAKDYKEQLPDFVKADRLQANLLKAQKFDRIRILKKGEIIEDSIVTAPMNKMAMASSVKSANGEVKGMLAEELAQMTPATWEVYHAFCKVICKIAETAKSMPITGVEFDWKARVGEVCAELGTEIEPIVVDQITEFLSGMDDEFYLKGISGTESFESFEAAGTALTEFAQKMRSNHAIRVKEGRMLSASNRAKIQVCMESMSAVMTDLEDLMAMSEPKPKAKEIDVGALRTQSMRLRSQVSRTLAHLS